MYEQGDSCVAALLLDARIVRSRYLDTAFPSDGSERTFTLAEVVLEVPSLLHARFDDEVTIRIVGALNDALIRDAIWVREMTLTVPPAPPTWRETLERSLGGDLESDRHLAYGTRVGWSRATA